jgi:cyclic beta-1,2-glucan synthetase
MGKGIYDVDAFADATDATFPENHILSHDLIEGCHARVGMVTDVEVFDEFPTRFDTFAARQRRWVRGDWQLLPWLFSAVPTAPGRRANPLTLLSRWKVFDNLRRSLVPPALVGLLLIAWLFFPPLAGMATVFVLGVAATHVIAQALSLLLTWSWGVDWQQRLLDQVGDLALTLVQAVLSLAFVPYKAQLMLDAAARTLYRLAVSHRRLLEWETADAAERRNRNNHWLSLREMIWVPILALAVAVVLPSASRPVAALILILWGLSPLAAYWLSRPLAQRTRSLDRAEQHELRRLARKTWAFFENFVGAEDHWLPPDNFQEYPKDKIAHRMSPTNEGLFIVSAVAAHDLGFLGLHDLVALLERNLQTLEQLDRHGGHFYNWYVTTTLATLAPRYISTADSGNLAACLMTASQALHELRRMPLLSERSTAGVLDSVVLAAESLARLQPRGARFGGAALTDLEESLGRVRAAAEATPTDLLAWAALIDQWHESAQELPARLQGFQAAVGTRTAEFSKKMEFLTRHLEGLHQDFVLLFPWLGLVPAGDRLPPAASAVAVSWSGSDNDAWQPLRTKLYEMTSLEDLATLGESIQPQIESLRAAVSARDGDGMTAKFEAFVVSLREGARQAIELCRRIDRLANRYYRLALEMDFKLTYDGQRRLFSVGWNQDDGRLDRARYDLLASEARIASLVAIAKGDVDHRHWFQLGRTLTVTEGIRGLLSWGGTMFEFLMPTLFIHDIDGSLLEQSCRAAVARQIAYGRKCHVPWGISESAFSAQAANTDYHYQSFGVPGLGIKRGLARDLVISPYSTALAVQIDPVQSVANLRDLIAEGAEGEWGLYDALDYTPSRVAAEERRNVVYCYMAHHHGMTMAAIANCLLGGCMQRRFQSQPLIRAVDLLLQERVPVAVLEFQPHADEAATIPLLPELPGTISRRLATPETAIPRTHLLSNGQYSVMLTNAGGGYSLCRSLAMTRWRADATRDHWGQFVYLRNVESGHTWSAGFQPTRAVPDAYEVTFAVDKAEIRRLDRSIETVLEVAVSPENNAEVRQVTIKNFGSGPAVVEATSYLELVLGPAGADIAHPAFNKLFVETEYLAQRRALLARRRPRDAEQAPIWAVHVLALPPGTEEAVEVETDRARFVGRGRTPAAPAAMDPGVRLSGSTGPVLDPAFSLRHRLSIPPGGSGSLAFTTAFADSREEALLLADQYHDARVVQRTFELAWANSQIELNRLKLTSASVQIFQRLASAAIYPDPAWRAPPDVLMANRRGQSALWRHGISGDFPLVVVGIAEPDQRGLLRELLLAHEFWHSHGLKVDLVVLNEHPGGYFDAFHEQLREQIQTTVHSPINKPGGVYLLQAAHLSEEDLLLLRARAALSLAASRGSLARQIESASEQPRSAPVATLKPAHGVSRPTPHSFRGPPPPPDQLLFSNGFGGFTPDGREYVIQLSAGQWTPAPWVNCIANQEFGCLVSEAGGGYTWAGNSRENKLTAWSNDPVTDAPGEIIYLRDDNSGDVWSPTPLPIRDDDDYLIAHGRGYSRFDHTAAEIQSQLLISIAPSSSVKFACLTLKNVSRRQRNLAVTYYAEWVLGDSRERTQTEVWTGADEATGALLARNSSHEDFPRQIVFLHVLDRQCTVTGDRREFLGRNRDFASPAALESGALSGTVGAGLDPSGALQTKVSLAPGEVVEVIFILGQVAAPDQLSAVLDKFNSAEQVHTAIAETVAFWEHTLTAVAVATPDPAFDLLANGWLLYQTLSCRIWGRSAFYQSGGAFGFRDQLQDVMALVYSLPHVAREHILRASARQFEQGDVQHWWHPPTGRGVRTRFSDDYLWLPFVVSQYVSTTGDAAILNEQVPFLRSASLTPQEEERYEHPEPTSAAQDLYSHCLLAIERAFHTGPHGLPLMGSGDWNDGMNRVGVLGQGESVWVAWFLIVVLRRFAPFVENRGDRDRATSFHSRADALLQSVEQNAWDGQWYLRAYFDDGTPLGSAMNEECRIDSLAQSWAAIAGGQGDRVRQALQAVDEYLVRAADREVLLFTPPFDKSHLNPGYIKGYLPGIRENGGQYTHASLWVILAQTCLGNGTRAAELFDMLNPVRLGSDSRRIETYRVEPYVIAADVYSEPPHVGRGGWTWYTGSAGWMYRIALESILGIRLSGDRLRVDPCIPAHWAGYKVVLRRGSQLWEIKVSNLKGIERGVRQVKVNGRVLEGFEIDLTTAGEQHLVEVEMGDEPSR